MLKRPAPIANSAFRPCTSLLLFCITPILLQGQSDKPNVAVSMYFVEEIVACSPNGYPESDGEAGSCPPLTFEDLERMTSPGMATPVQRSIPPEQVNLGTSLLDHVESFSDDCPITAPCANDPQRRYSIILAFEVMGTDNLQGHDIQLRRTSSPFGSYSASGTLSERGRWINHQRADAFLPSNRVRWELRIGEWTWNLGVAR